VEVAHRVDAWLFLPRPRAEVFPFFAGVGNLDRITPPELNFRILEQPVQMGEGGLIRYRLRLDGIPFGWLTRITRWEPGRAFVDEQLAGPYRRWIHAHEFDDAPGGGTRIRDRVDLVLPLQPVGELAWPYVRRKLRRIFEFRQAAVAEAFGVDLRPGMSAVELS
jgi:ligand-binding SRPBCC domain-containing protein